MANNRISKKVRIKPSDEPKREAEQRDPNLVAGERGGETAEQNTNDEPPIVQRTP